MTRTTKSKALEPRPDRLIDLYGDLIFDLCQSTLWSIPNAQVSFRSIVRHIRASRAKFLDYERAWVLHETCSLLRHYVYRHGRRLTSAEQIMLDSSPEAEKRLVMIDSYFHRLPFDSQVLLLLRDKYGLPYSEIATALGIPEGSLKVRRQQSLRNLEEWIWT